MSNATENLHLILLDLHSAATAVAPLSALEISVDLIQVYRHAGRQTLKYRDQSAAM
jgi:hypothetical protein